MGTRLLSGPAHVIVSLPLFIAPCCVFACSERAAGQAVQFVSQRSDPSIYNAMSSYVYQFQCNTICGRTKASREHACDAGTKGPCMVQAGLPGRGAGVKRRGRFCDSVYPRDERVWPSRLSPLHVLLVTCAECAVLNVALSGGCTRRGEGVREVHIVRRSAVDSLQDQHNGKC